MATATRTIRAPRGTPLACNRWQQEAALRMLSRSLDRGGAEQPDDFIGHLRSEKTAPHWPAGPGGVVRARPPVVTIHNTGALVIGADAGMGPSVVVAPMREGRAC